VVLSPDHVRDPGVQVVHRDGEVVQDRPVSPGDYRVIHVGVGKPGLAPNDVVHHGLALVRDAEPDRTGGFGLAAEAPF
jgi:hypothetical protein